MCLAMAAASTTPAAGASGPTATPGASVKLNGAAAVGGNGAGGGGGGGGGRFTPSPHSVSGSSSPSSFSHNGGGGSSGGPPGSASNQHVVNYHVHVGEMISMQMPDGTMSVIAGRAHIRKLSRCSFHMI